MDFKIDIKPEEVNDHVAKAVLESSLGDHIKKAIDSDIKKITQGSYGNPSAIQRAVSQHVRDIVEKLVMSDYKEAIEAEVREVMTKETIRELVNNVYKAIDEKVRGY